MTRKITILLVVILLGFRPSSKADEGMWLPFMIDDQLHATMQEMGLKLTPEQIFSFNESSIKDAIVSFGGFCTGEIISDKGLVLTNHHCGYGRIQAHSTPENDYLTHGFWAMSLEEELPNPGLFVSFLVSVMDVTEKFNAELNDTMSLNQRNATIRQLSSKLADEATEGTHYQANVRSMFAGNEFFLFVYERFTDVRMVGVPPSSIGKYGGDTDNWMWPRHTGDFMLFRVYSAPDGTPADYAAENIPLKPRHHLPVSAKGVSEGDFTMVLGYPGGTDRYLTSYGIDFKLKNEFPVRIDIRRQKLDIIEQAMASSDAIRIQYASKQSGISNYWKNFIGMSNALQRLNVAQSKKELENEFQAWVEADETRLQEYGKVLEMFADAYKGYESMHSHNFIYSEAIITGPDVFRTAMGYRTLERLLEEKADSEKILEETEKLKAAIERQYRNYNHEVDRQLWANMTSLYSGLVPQHIQPVVFLEINRKFRGDFIKFSNEVYSKSIFANAQALESFLEKPSLRKLQNDWVFRLGNAIFEVHQNLQKQMEQHDEQLATANRLFIKGLREMDPNRSFYPDANSTMRFTYGTVGGYWPADAVYYSHITTIEGVMEKENPNHHEFVVPEKLSQLHQERDFGAYGIDQTQVVNFISNNDITGGNSGSPVLDAEGNLIGLAFDGNWEAMSGDILFEHEMQKCINVDARYILFVIDKYAGASHLIEEMTIIW